MTGDLGPRRSGVLHQFSFVDALVAGLYEGAFRASAVLAEGDFGVGCGDALDGEIVLLDGAMHLCRGDGSVVDVLPDAMLPFAEVAHFRPTYREPVADLTELDFDALVDSLTPSGNLFYGIRVDGIFERMTVREAVRQQQPYRGLAEAVRGQHEDTAARTTGTLIGFRGPDVFQGLSVAEFHLHYINDERTFGGHVMDFRLASGMLALEAYDTFTLHLPAVESYLSAPLRRSDSDAEIRHAEGT
ncbi:MAG: acetolactate decarboxylase [Rhodoglobus sp.]